jgi:hypothetical protein
MNIAHRAFTALQLCGIISTIAILSGCGSMKPVGNARYREISIDHTIPYEAIEEKDDQRVPQYALPDPILRLNQHEFLLVRNEGDGNGLSLERFNDSLQRIWSMHFGEDGLERFETMFLHEGKLFLIDSRFEENVASALLRSFDPGDGHPLRVDTIDSGPGAPGWLSAEEMKWGRGPYAALFSRDSSHLLVYCRTYAPMEDQYPEHKLAYDATVLGPHLENVGRAHLPVPLDGDHNAAIGLFPGNNGDLFLTYRRGHDTIVIAKHEIVTGSERAMMITQPSGSPAATFTVGGGVAPFGTDSLLLAYLRQPDRKEDSVTLNLAVLDFPAMTSKRIATTTLPRTSASGKGFRGPQIRELIISPERNYWIFVEPRWTNVSATASGGAVDASIETGDIFITGFNRTGTPLAITRLTRSQLTRPSHGWGELGYKSLIDGRNDVQIVYRDFPTDRLMWYTLKHNGSIELHPALATFEAPSTLLIPYTTWLSDHTFVTMVSTGLFGRSLRLCSISLPPDAEAKH